MDGNKTLQTRGKIPAAAKWVVILSLLLFFFAHPAHPGGLCPGGAGKTWSSGPAAGLPGSSLFALQGLALFWLGREKRSSYLSACRAGHRLGPGGRLGAVAGHPDFRELPGRVDLCTLCGRHDPDRYPSFSGISAGSEKNRQLRKGTMNMPGRASPDVLIVGAGPAGLTAAAEALRHGLSVRVIDENDSRSIHSKALVVHSRTLEIFQDMGLVSCVLENGRKFDALNIYTTGSGLHGSCLRSSTGRMPFIRSG